MNNNLASKWEGLLMKRRLVYIVATILLLCIEVIIALFVHDNFIRPYVGDILVVVVIYTFIRILIPDKIRILSIYMRMPEKEFLLLIAIPAFENVCTHTAYSPRLLLHK